MPFQYLAVDSTDYAEPAQEPALADVNASFLLNDEGKHVVLTNSRRVLVFISDEKDLKFQE